MKRIVVALGCAICMSGSFAQSAPPVQEITKQIIRSATGYANSISCQGVTIQPKQIAALVPYKTMDDRSDAKYAVLWDGDIGCLGGSGTSTENISIVTISTGDSYVVDPRLSSPLIEFSPGLHNIDRIVGNTKDTLILEGLEFGPNDPHCCPSVRVRITMRVDEKGNWKVVEKKTVQPKK